MQVSISRVRSDALPPPPHEVIKEAIKCQEISIEWLAGDGSDRCYYRIYTPQSSYVLMQLSESDARKLRDDGYDWLKIANIFRHYGVLAPRPILSLFDHAALIIEDYGDVMLETLVEKLSAEGDEKSIFRLYEAAIDIIVSMLKIPRNDPEIWCQRAFDFEKYAWELRFFRREFLDGALHLELNAAQVAAFEHDVDTLSQELSQYSKFFCHRDYHSRNIMVKNEALALIDFQDARLGAASYDLVSLVFDNYVPLTLMQRRHILTSGTKIIEAGLGVSLAKELGAVVLQRQLKAIGTYGFLTISKKRGNYLKYVKPAMDTLAPDLVYSEKWPFLSGELLQILNAKVATLG